jgi:hypothetical protein
MMRFPNFRRWPGISTNGCAMTSLTTPTLNILCRQAGADPAPEALILPQGGSGVLAASACQNAWAGRTAIKRRRMDLLAFHWCCRGHFSFHQVCPAPVWAPVRT